MAEKVEEEEFETESLFQPTGVSESLRLERLKRLEIESN